MTIQIDNFGPIQGGGARRGTVRSTIAFALASAAVLVTSATSADASAREISASSYGFVDWTNPEFSRPKSPSPPVGDWALRCFLDCGPAVGTYVVRRNELLTSNAADVSEKKTADATGRAMGVSGVILVERLELDAIGSLTNWVVVSERTFDGDGSHSWSLLASDASLDSPWLPTNLYRFEGFSFSVDSAAGAPAGADARTVDLGDDADRLRRAQLGGISKLEKRSIHFPNGIYAR